MSRRQRALPPVALVQVWLVSDARNDAFLEAALTRLPRGSGFIFRHTHLPPAERRARFEALRRIARLRRLCIVLSGDARTAKRWGADGAYGSADALTHGPALLRLVTAHTLREIADARRARADAILLSPVFPTRSHPGAKTLGPVGFRLLAARAGLPVIALGGMDATLARRLRWPRWAAIDGLSGKVGARPSTGSG